MPARPEGKASQLGRVSVAFKPITFGSDWFRGRVTYILEDRVWTQEFTTANVTDEEAETAGLHLSAG